MLSCATASAFVLCFFLALDVYEFCYAIGYDSSVLITSNIQLFGNDKPHVIIMQQQVRNEDLFMHISLAKLDKEIRDLIL